MVAGGVVNAQNVPSASQYKFEAASIKPSKAVDNSSRLGPGPQGGLNAVNVTTARLISFAYGVRDFQIVGAPKWVESDRFDILATPEQAEEQPSPNMARDKLEGFIARLRQRVQGLLSERYGLIIRPETREMPVYSLGIAKSGHKMTPSSVDKPPSMSNGRGAMKGTAANTNMIADSLSGVLFHPVIDDTGLTGVYDLKMEWTPEPPAGEPPAADATGPSIFTAIQEQLGLKLESRKAPAPVVVIEKIDRPSEN